MLYIIKMSDFEIEYDQTVVELDKNEVDSTQDELVIGKHKVRKPRTEQQLKALKAGREKRSKLKLVKDNENKEAYKQKIIEEYEYNKYLNKKSNSKKSEPKKYKANEQQPEYEQYEQYEEQRPQRIFNPNNPFAYFT
jgi:hypothetical protein